MRFSAGSKIEIKRLAFEVFVVNLLSASVFCQTALTPFKASAGMGIQITVNKTEIGEGQNVVVNVKAQHANEQPIASLMLHARVNGNDWGADYPTLPSGVAHILLPLPETGKNSIVITDGSNISNVVTVEVNPRQFDIIEDPDHLIVMEYETWFGPGYAQWGDEEATSVLGHYSSLDPRVLRQQALWFNEMGVNVVETDWTNNLAAPFPNAPAKECIEATDKLFRVYSTMRQHPKILFLMGPEHNRWDSVKDTYDGPWYKDQINYIYDHYIDNPQYRDMYLKYEGKPLLLLYLNGPHFGTPPDVHDSRFTIRYVGAWLQTTHEQEYGIWSWYDQTPTPIYYKGKVEALTITDGYPAVHGTATKLNNWLAQDAGGKNYGETYLSQWDAAMKLRPRFLFLNQWNEFEVPDQYDANLSNDLEPTIMTDKGDPRASGWGFFYYNLTRQKIAEYHRLLAAH